MQKEEKQMEEKVMGMVLAASPIGDYDKRLVILTKEYGKISAFARGARRPNSPFLACSQPFSFGEFAVFRGRDSFTVKSAKISNYFTELREEIEDIYYGSYFCEMASYFTKENLDGTEVLALLYQSMRALKVESIGRELVRYIFELKMMMINGEAPRVFSCIHCGGKEKLHYLDVKNAGIYCEDCGKVINGSIMISETTAYTMQHIISQPITKLYTFTVTDVVRNELKKVMKAYLKEYLSVSFHSLEQIEEF